MSVLSRLQSLAWASFLLSLFPWTVTALFFNLALLALDIKPTVRARLRHLPSFQRRNVLITGIDSPQGLHLARSFYSSGHNVFAVSTVNELLPLHASFSSVIQRFYQLKHSPAQDSVAEFTQDILAIIKAENIELWVDCSQPRLDSLLRQVREVVERNSRALLFLPPGKHLDLFASSDSFLTYAHNQGLPSLDRYQVGSRAEIHDVLNTSRGKKRYTLTGPGGTAATKSVLPRRTQSQTYDEIAQVKVQKNSPWQLQQYVEGQERYTTASVIVKGHLRAFSAGLLSVPHYLYRLPPRSATNKALRSYVKALANRLGPDFTGHLSIDFVTDEVPSPAGVEKLHFPVDARLDPGTSLLLFRGIQEQFVLTQAYVDFLPSMTNGVLSLSINGLSDVDAAAASDDDDNHDNHDGAVGNGNGKTLGKPDAALSTTTTTNNRVRGVYSLGYDVSQWAVLPVGKLLTFKLGIVHVLAGFATLLSHVWTGHECLYDFRDPLPFWYLYQIYLPLTLIRVAITVNLKGDPSSRIRLQNLRRYIGGARVD